MNYQQRQLTAPSTVVVVHRGEVAVTDKWMAMGEADPSIVRMVKNAIRNHHLQTVTCKAENEVFDGDCNEKCSMEWLCKVGKPR